MTTDARGLGDRIINDALNVSVRNEDSTKLRLDARELQANPQAWRDVNDLIQDFNKTSAAKHLPTITITHSDGQTEITETPSQSKSSVADHLIQDGSMIAGGAGTGALAGALLGPELAPVGAVAGAIFGTTSAVTMELAKLLVKDRVAATVNSRE